MHLYKGPLLIIHETDDDLVSHEMGRKLYDSRTVSNSICLLEGAGYSDALLKGGDTYFNSINKFLQNIESN